MNIEPDSKSKQEDSISNKCPECGGTGFISVWYSDDYSKTVYGDDRKIEYPRRCPRCKASERETGCITGIPKLFHDADISKFRWKIYDNEDYMRKIHSYISSFVRNYKEWAKDNRGLYIWSKTSGSGKTFLACCIANSSMIGNDISMRFITAPDYFNLLKEKMDAEKGAVDKTYIYRVCDLLVFDDIGAQPSKEWYDTELYRLIDERMVNNRLTIFTSNLDIEELKCSDRVIDRINKCAVVIHFPEQSIRRKQANEKNREFLEKMGLIGE